MLSRIMSLIASFSTNIEYSSVFKRDFLCMYASFLRESPAFAEEMCSQKAFLNDLLNAGMFELTRWMYLQLLPKDLFKPSL